MPAKATENEALPIRATVFRDGHDRFGAEAVLITPEGDEYQRERMYEIGTGIDRMEAWVMPDRPGDWFFRIDTWSDPLTTWLRNSSAKLRAGIDKELVCLEGIELFKRVLAQAPRRSTRPPARPRIAAQPLDEESKQLLTKALEYLGDESLPADARFRAVDSPEIRAVFEKYPLRDFAEATVRYPLQVDRTTALYGSWYEIFPRSIGAHLDDSGNWVSGTLRTAVTALDRIADLGFNVVYLTPVHPIGTQFRKGRNNTLEAGPDDPGSPYGIGALDGGHDAINPDLGTFDDFDYFVDQASQRGMQVALDLALQASPDHPWVKEHPEWFTIRADGSIAYAENPPKKYQDIYPLNFDNDPKGIYQAIVDVVEKWISHGVRIFRVDNPHTKTIPFWQKFLHQMREDHPDVLFLAEAFTRPAMMRTLGMVGFQQSYTYFAWRTSKRELEEYFVEVGTETAHMMRPAFWPTTHDILTPQMTSGGTAIFAIRAILAATGAPTWGIYSGYELVENVARPGFEEHIDNEKYEYRPRDWSEAEEFGIEPLLQMLNEARSTHPALQQLHQISIHATSSDSLLAFSKHVPARFSATGKDDTVLVVVSLDPHTEVEGTVYLDRNALFPTLSAEPRPGWTNGALKMVDTLGNSEYTWGDENYVRLSPWERIAHVFSVEKP